MVAPTPAKETTEALYASCIGVIIQRVVASLAVKDVIAAPGVKGDLQGIAIEDVIAVSSLEPIVSASACVLRTHHDVDDPLMRRAASCA